MDTTAIPLHLASISLGAMLFFSFVVAPLVFVKLPTQHAAAFIRALFPWYYAVLGAVTAAAALTGAVTGSDRWPVLLLVSAAFFFALFLLMPTINRARDRQNAGDDGARSVFKRLHAASVAINAGQMLALAYYTVSAGAAG